MLPMSGLATVMLLRLHHAQQASQVV